MKMASTMPDRDVLPSTLTPFHYELSLYDVEMGGSFTFQGTVKIHARIILECNEITLNANQLNISSAEVQGVSPKEITYDAASQRTTLHLEDALPVSDEAVIVIKYQGLINTNMTGFYRSKYKPVVPPAASVPMIEDYHWHFSTQFEACEARRAFPCFDEPALKATFDLKVELPEDQVALSNMPVKSTNKGKQGLQVVEFERTPKMSTYLLAWAFGDFEYLETFTERRYRGKPLPYRIYTTRGMKNQGQHALEHGPKIIDLFSDLFSVEYPLPKIDILAVHEFTHNAMENWGLVTYRASSVLFNEETSDQKYKKFIVYVLGHEMAHQWFGDLVTMEWWSDLWLNEGFATWVGYLAVDYIHPEWKIWEDFIFECGDKALSLDSLRSSHPIELPLKNAIEVDQAFDAISYYKGSYVIRMLAEYLGQDTFLRGVSIYLKRHAFGNATTNDLWVAVSEASGRDIKVLIDPWILRMGYPVLTVAEEPGQISIQQKRFLSTGDVALDDDTTIWWIPLGLRNGSELSKATMTTKEDTIRDIDDAFYKINAGAASCYRVNYPLSRLIRLGKQLDRLTGPEKIGLINDASALAFAGEGTTPALLAFLRGFTHETSYYVWQTVITAIGIMQSVFSQNPAFAKGFNKLLLELISPTVERLGWKPSPNEDYLTTQLRSLLILAAGRSGHEKVIDEVLRRFSRYTTNYDTDAIPNNLRGAIYTVVARQATEEQYHILTSEFRSTALLGVKETILRALGSLQSPSLIKTHVAFLFTAAAPADIHFGIDSLADNPLARDILWQYVQEHFDEIREKYGTNALIFDRLLLMSLRMFSQRDKADEIEGFFETRDTRGFERTIGILGDTIRGRADYRGRDGETILEWLKAGGYA